MINYHQYCLMVLAFKAFKLDDHFYDIFKQIINIYIMDTENRLQYEKVQQEQNLITKQQLFNSIWNLGFITYGGPMSHIGVLRQIFIVKLRSITQDKFTQLLTISQSLPGPTSTQLLIALSIYSTSQFISGLLAFIIFSMPSFIVMYLAGLYLTDIPIDSKIGQIFKGFRVVSIGIILQAFWGLSTKYRKQSSSVLLFVFSALTYRFFQSTYTIIILFVIGGFYSFLNPPPLQASNRSIIANKFHGPFYGIKNMYIFVILLTLTVFIKMITFNKLLQIFCIFYRIGSIVIGGGHVILPMMLSQFQQYGYFSQDAYWNGFSIISFLPGPMFNLSVYIGTIVTHDIFGALSGFIGLYTPCFLFILFILPHWQNYRKKQGIKNFINGMCCVSVGLILTASIILWENTCLSKDNYKSYFQTLIVLTCFILLQVYKFNVVTGLILGQFLYLIFVFII